MPSHTPVPRAAAPKPSLRSTVMRVGAAALAAATVLWSVLFYGAVTNHNAAATATQASVTQSSPTGHATHTLTPVTTRTS